jgi:hypothetical protein
MTQPVVFGEIQMHLADPCRGSSFLTKVWYDGLDPHVLLEPEGYAPVLALHAVNAGAMSYMLKDAADYVIEATSVAASTIRRLPVLTLCRQRYYLDERLHELRHVEMPEVTVDLPRF